MRLVGNDDRGQPSGIRKGDQAALPWHVAGQVVDDLQEGRVVHRGGERDPFGLADVVGEDLWVAKFRPARGQRFPKGPGAAVGLCQQLRRFIHRAQTGRLGHRTQGQQDQIFIPDRDLAGFAGPVIGDARDPQLAVLLAQPQIRDAGIELDLDVPRLEPLLQGPHHGVILIVDRAHDPVQAIKAVDHVGETNEIALEFDGAVPRLKGEGRAPHEPEIGLEERGVELIGNHRGAQHALRFERQALDGQDVGFAEPELGSRLPLALAHQAGLGRGLHRLVPGEGLLGHGSALVERRDR